MTTPRIAPGTLREAGPLAWLIAQVGGKQAGTAPLNLFLTLGKHHKLFRAWLRFAGRLMPRGALPRRETELVILRVAHLRDCEYEAAHHRRLGRRAGLTVDDLQRVLVGAAADGWSPREHAILAAVDTLDAKNDLDDETWTALRAQLSETECIELLMLVGHYQFLATTITALRIQPES